MPACVFLRVQLLCMCTRAYNKYHCCWAQCSQCTRHIHINKYIWSDVWAIHGKSHINDQRLEVHDCQFWVLVWQRFLYLCLFLWQEKWTLSLLNCIANFCFSFGLSLSHSAFNCKRVKKSVSTIKQREYGQKKQSILIGMYTVHDDNWQTSKYEMNAFYMDPFVVIYFA